MFNKEKFRIMNILIIGEFSAFAKHLKNGLVQLGHKVTIVHTGDGWLDLGDNDDIIFKKKSLSFGGYHIKGSTLFSVVIENLRVDRLLQKHIRGIDLIIVVNFGFIRKNLLHFGVKYKILKKWVRNGAPLLMMECGNSPAVMYYMPDFYKRQNISVNLNDSRYVYLLDHCSVIIPTAYDYYAGLVKYSNYYQFDKEKIHHAIPLPMTLDKKCTITSCINRKIIIFHGISRPLSKGTPFIKEAMDRIQLEMPEKVECIAKGGIPYNEYTQLLDSTDIIIDQTYVNGWGVNAEIGALLGKCVLTSCGPENKENMKLPYTPFIQIGPDSEQIYLTLRELVLHPERVDKIKIESRLFIEKYCDSKIVAQQYLEAVGLLAQN